MGGDRLLILEDGERTGDKSASAADHAVAIDPSTAKNIKVIRGPASLIYGSNTLGGVIDVKRESSRRLCLITLLWTSSFRVNPSILNHRYDRIDGSNR